MEFLSFKFILEWVSFLALFFFAIYTLLVIKNEKKTFLKNAKVKMFYNLKLMYPQWWGEVSTENSAHLQFKRLDTRYDWVANFIFLGIKDEQLSIQEILKNSLEEKKMLFDQDTTIITNPSDFKALALLQTGKFEMCRVEGTATIDREDRTYYDAFMIRNLETKVLYFMESKSSILNGLVEGPYFEEVVERLEYIA